MLRTIDMIITVIKKTINDNPYLKIKFNHPNRKYHMDEILPYIIQVLEQGISYRNIKTESNICWNTIYKYYRLLVKYKIIEQTYEKLINKYLHKLDKLPNNLYDDSSLVCNKLGEDKADYNPYSPKHKLSKFSIINDDFLIPISIGVDSGSVHDIVMLNDQLGKLKETHPILFKNKVNLILDAGYDSTKLKEEVKNLNLGRVICYRNRRNSKKREITEDYTLRDYLLLKSRMKSEHTMCSFKQFKRIDRRYDRCIINYLNFMYLGAIKIIIKKIGLFLI
jgi:hypothetical protein